MNPQEANIVKAIFRTFIDTGSTSRTARLINKAGHTTKQGRQFSPQTITRILKNDFYTGVITYKGTKKRGQHKAIISKHLFTKAQNRFKKGE